MKLSVEDRERILQEAIEAMRLPQIEKHEMTAAQLATEIGVAANTVRSWRKDGNARFSELFQWRRCIVDEFGHIGWAFSARNGDGE